MNGNNVFTKFITDKLQLPITLAEDIVNHFDYEILPPNTFLLNLEKFAINTCLSTMGLCVHTFLIMI